jgi:hypothetical protein
MADKRTFVVKRDGFILGNWFNHNAHIELTDEQAAIFVAEGTIEAKPEPASEPRPRPVARPPADAQG